MAEPLSILDLPGLRERTTNAFRHALVTQCRVAGLNADHVASVIAYESGFRANVQNAEGYASLGLIQFQHAGFSDLARCAGIDESWEDLRHMSALEQVPLVVCYFKRTGVGRINASATDYYVATFLPVYLGFPGSTVIAERDSQERILKTRLTKGEVYRKNRTLDANGDGVITIDDLTNRIGTMINLCSSLPRLPIDAPALSPRRDGALVAVGAAGFTSFFFASGVFSTQVIT